MTHRKPLYMFCPDEERLPLTLSRDIPQEEKMLLHILRVVYRNNAIRIIEYKLNEHESLIIQRLPALVNGYNFKLRYK